MFWNILKCFWMYWKVEVSSKQRFKKSSKKYCFRAERLLRNITPWQMEWKMMMNVFLRLSTQHTRSTRINYSVGWIAFMPITSQEKSLATLSVDSVFFPSFAQNSCTWLFLAIFVFILTSTKEKNNL